MFDIGWSELLLIGIVALIAIGPKELPGALRSLGQWTGKLRRMASEFQSQFHEAMREAEMADLKKQVDEMTTQAQSYANFDPIGDVRKEFESTQRQIESTIDDRATLAGGPEGTPSPATDVASPESSVAPGQADDEPILQPATDVPAAPSPAPVGHAVTEPADKHAGDKPA